MICGLSLPLLGSYARRKKGIAGEELGEWLTGYRAFSPEPCGRIEDTGSSNEHCTLEETGWRLIMRCRIGCRNIKLNWPRIADKGTCATKWLVQTKGTGRSKGRWFKGLRVLPDIRSRVRKSQERKDPAPAELFGAEENDAQLCCKSLSEFGC